MAEILKSDEARRHVQDAASSLGHARDAEQAAGNPRQAAILNECTLALFALAIRVED